MIYLHYKDTKTFGHSFSFLLIFKTLRASYLQVGNFSNSMGSLLHPQGLSAVPSCQVYFYKHVLITNKLHDCSSESLWGLLCGWVYGFGG